MRSTAATVGRRETSQEEEEEEEEEGGREGERRRRSQLVFQQRVSRVCVFVCDLAACVAKFLRHTREQLVSVRRAVAQRSPSPWSPTTRCPCGA